MFPVSTAEERHGGGLRRASAEEAAGGGGAVQPGPLPLHLHPGSGPQDPRPAATGQELKRTHATRPFVLKDQDDQRCKTFLYIAFTGNICPFFIELLSIMG